MKIFYNTSPLSELSSSVISFRVKLAITKSEVDSVLDFMNTGLKLKAFRLSSMQCSSVESMMHLLQRLTDYSDPNNIFELELYPRFLVRSASMEQTVKIIYGKMPSINRIEHYLLFAELSRFFTTSEPSTESKKIRYREISDDLFYEMLNRSWGNISSLEYAASNRLNVLNLLYNLIMISNKVTR